jgi:HD superfamily phosphohydrolase
MSAQHLQVLLDDVRASDWYDEISVGAEGWMSGATESLDRRPGLPSTLIRDPVWGLLELSAAEVVLLNSPLLQRQRWFRQLPAGHYLYPAATHSRIEHALGVVAAAHKFISGLGRCAERRNFPVPTAGDIQAIRIAALLSGIGYGAFGNIVEQIAEQRLATELRLLRTALHRHFPDANEPTVFQLVTVLTVLSPSFLQVLKHPSFDAPERELLPLKIISSLLGSAKYYSNSYLAKIVNGPLDANTCDSFLRDQHTIGLPTAFDFEGLVHSLEIIDASEINDPAYARLKGLHFAFSEASLKVSQEFTLARQYFYKVTYEHKAFRAITLMIQRLITLHESDRGFAFSIKDLLSDNDERQFLKNIAEGPGSEPARTLAGRLLKRDLFKLSLTVTPDFVGGFDKLSEAERGEARAVLSREICRLLSNEASRTALEDRIAARSRDISTNLGRELAGAEDIMSWHVMSDMPQPLDLAIPNVLLRLKNGRVTDSTRHLDLDKLTEAYHLERIRFYIFCPKSMVTAANLATRAIFSEEFQIAFGSEADPEELARLSAERYEELENLASISAETLETMKGEVPPPVHIRAEEVRLPKSWHKEFPELALQLARKLARARPRGYRVEMKSAILRLIEALTRFCDVMYQGGTLKALTIKNEATLHRALCDFMRARDLKIEEKSKVAGGELDLWFEDEIVIEVKIHATPTDEPMIVSHNYPMQTRRYGIAKTSTVMAIVLGYKPSTERGHRFGRDVIDVRRMSEETVVEVRACLPIDYSSPSKAGVH